MAKKRKKGKPKKLYQYTLRKYFRKHCIPEDQSYREFWMAHSLGTDEHYISRDVEYHRELYKAAYPDLRIYEETKDETIRLLEDRIGQLEKQTLRDRAVIQRLLGKDVEVPPLEPTLSTREKAELQRLYKRYTKDVEKNEDK